MMMMTTMINEEKAHYVHVVYMLEIVVHRSNASTSRPRSDLSKDPAGDTIPRSR